MIIRLLLYETTRYAPASPLFLEALEELAGRGKLQFALFDEAAYLRSAKSLIARAARRAIGIPPVRRNQLNRSLLAKAAAFGPDAVLVGKGAFIRPATLLEVKARTGALLINYAADDPFNPAASTRDLLASIPLYDLYCCTKRAIMPDVERAGCRRAIFVPFAYKPSIHFAETPSTPEEKARFDAQVVFIGGCDQDRIPYFETLLRRLPGLKLHLYGGFWNRHVALRRYWRGFAIGRDYRLALGGARIVINLVRRANRDGHVMRSFEIPACGAFMLAERTEEHLELFAEGRDAAYFDSPDELADKIAYYLAHEEERVAIARAGYARVTQGAHTYKDRLVQILQKSGLSGGRSNSKSCGG